MNCKQSLCLINLSVVCCVLYVYDCVQVDPQFFAFRWITLLLTQEFPFPDAVRIWDTLLSDPGGRVDCLLRVCIAMLMNVRQQLLEGKPFAPHVQSIGGCGSDQTQPAVVVARHGLCTGLILIKSSSQTAKASQFRCTPVLLVHMEPSQ